MRRSKRRAKNGRGWLGNAIRRLANATGGYDLFAAGEAEAQRQAEDEHYAKSAFDGTFSSIVCIGLFEFSDQMEPRGAVAWYGEQRARTSASVLEPFGPRQAVACSLRTMDWDLTFRLSRKRSIIHQVKPSMEINLAKFRTEPVYDTMAIWSNWDTRGWVKLDVLARALNVETKSGSGAQVAEMWGSGQGLELARYCLQDTYVTYACYCRMNFRQPLSSEVVLLQPELLDVG